MKQRLLVSFVAAGLVLLPVCGVLAQATQPLNPTPNRESKVLVGFETDVKATSDPNDAGENRASVNTSAQFVSEGTKSLCLNLTDVGGDRETFFAIDLAQPVEVKGFGTLSMDVFLPLQSLSNGDTAGGFWQFWLILTTTASLTDTTTSVTYYGVRNMGPGWNHLVWDIKAGTDTRITRIAFGGNSNESKPYTGPIYVDNIRVYKGSFAGLQPDEKLIQGFEKATDAQFFAGSPVPVTVNTDKQFIRDGAGSLKIDLTGQGGSPAEVIRASDWGMTGDVSNATALHLDIFVPEGSWPEEWGELGFGVIGAGGDVSGSTHGQLIPGQWNTLQIALTPEQAKRLTDVKGIFLRRNQGSAWRGAVYADNLRAVVPTRPAMTTPTAGR